MAHPGVTPSVAGCRSWKLGVELEKRLRAESRKAAFWDSSIRKLRAAVRDAYEAALFEDYQFCQVRLVAVPEAAARGRTAQSQVITADGQLSSSRPVISHRY